MYDYEWLKKRDEEVYDSLMEKMYDMSVKTSDKNFNRILEVYLERMYPEIYEEFKNQVFDIPTDNKQANRNNQNENNNSSDFITAGLFVIVILLIIIIPMIMKLSEKW